MPERIRLLTTLAGCPEGATQHALATVHGFAPGLIYQCVDRKLVGVQTQIAAASSGAQQMTVFRFHITKAGRQLIRSGVGKVFAYADAT
jgi:hypothetical protein